MTIDHRGAWSDFWAQNSQPGKRSGCLPDSWQGIDAAQRKAWTAFSKRLRKGANVLDLATGDGCVMRWMQSARRDLKLIGVDLSDQLPEPPRGTKVRTGVAMEKLPFPDGRFAAVVSQFGFEYADLPRAAAEVSRVLSQDGVVRMMTHRKDGPILAHNIARREQIEWVLAERDLPALAKRSLAMRRIGVGTIPPAIAQAPALGAQQFGPQSAAWEVAEAIRQCLLLGQRDLPGNVARLIDNVVAKARNELDRIASLEAACEQTAEADAFAGALEAAGLTEIERSPLHDPAYPKPFADFRLIRRA